MPVMWLEGRGTGTQKLDDQTAGFPGDHEEKACSNCKSIAVEKINPKRWIKLL